MTLIGIAAIIAACAYALKHIDNWIQQKENRLCAKWRYRTTKKQYDNEVV